MPRHRCPTCGILPRVITPEQAAKSRLRAKAQWIRRKAILAAHKTAT